VAVVLPGSASTTDFVRRAFEVPLAAAGFCLVTTDPPSGPRVLDDQLRALDEAADRFHPTLVGGVSLGAQLVARWAGSSRGELSGLLLVMPAWTGPPDAVAAVSAATATDVERDGIAATLTRLRSRIAPEDPGTWVLDELAAAWPRYSEAGLAAALRATAASTAPELGTLAGLDLPCGVVALADDPMHPAAVAAEWAGALPAGSLVRTDLATVGADRSTLGAAALQAWVSASEAAGKVRH
jgi:pimeloyl-ACP methyl ester carboxylesterase